MKFIQLDYVDQSMLLAKEGEREGRTVRARDEQTVKRFNHVTGFGFIAPSVGNDDLVVYRSSIRDGGFFGLVEGESVEFFVEYTENRIKAVDVTGPMESLTQGAIRRGGYGYGVIGGVVSVLSAVDEDGAGGENGNPEVEEEILREIEEKSDSPIYEEVKDMVYTHASLCESMRLYPPVPADSKEAMDDDVLLDGTVVKKGMRVTYHPYAMGRLERLWGSDWEDFCPERWLEKEAVTEKLRFVGRDAYTYTVFQAGPRIYLGKEMAFLQMKMVVAGVLWRFRVVPAMEEGVEPMFISYLTSKMKGGFSGIIKERDDKF
ncbi:cytochrome P450 94A1-like [Cornus florida]|uniref:cytochrome P450 94A1-like n=1 Tax=Cornus florida TaxID=4283 RepID=UPI0028A2D1C9|nr:cytochrome P450 94A1-like [Cornus florida]